MAVAKSYESYEIIGNPYTVDGKLYVKVKHPCPRCGGSGHYSMNAMGDSTCYRCGGSKWEVKEVRWYTDAQRAALDRAAEKRAGIAQIKKEERRIKFAARNAFGFGEAGFITLFRGDNNVLNEWAHETDPCRARFNLLFGWFLPSRMTAENLPEGIEMVRLDWDKVCINELEIKPDDEVKAVIRELIGPTSKSIYQGEVGQWIERELTVRKQFRSDSRYGDKYTHVMIDSEGNVYQWATGSKNFPEGSIIHLKMKVKEHKEVSDEPRTIVWYCKEV